MVQKHLFCCIFTLQRVLYIKKLTSPACSLCLLWHPFIVLFKMPEQYTGQLHLVLMHTCHVDTKDDNFLAKDHYILSITVPQTLVHCNNSIIRDVLLASLFRHLKFSSIAVTAYSVLKKQPTCFPHLKHCPILATGFSGVKECNIYNQSILFRIVGIGPHVAVRILGWFRSENRNFKACFYTKRTLPSGNSLMFEIWK